MSSPAAPPPVRKGNRFLRWQSRVLGICLAIFAFELGLFLVIFPWLRNWDISSIPLRFPFAATFWMSSYFRGFLSGLGFLNVYVGISEMFRHLREIFSRSH